MTTINTDQPIAPEWSHLIKADTIEAKPVKMSIAPSEQQVQALLPRLGVEKLENLRADLTLRRQNMVVHITGALKADITQNCVVSLQPVETAIHEDIEAWFADPEQAISIAKARREKEIKKGRNDLPVLEESEDPEPIVDGFIDLGEVVVQFLVLAIDPYPHAQGVEHEYGDDDGVHESSVTRKNPFAALAEWKEKLK